MRLSTVVTHQLGVNAMTRQEAQVIETMQQLASGRRVLTPADDPLAASQAVNVAQTESANLRYGVNRDIARENLYLQDQSLVAIGGALQEVSTRLVEAGNGAYSDADRASIATVIQGLRESLLGYANTTNGNGQYIYGGDKGDVQPFATNPADNSVTYRGDNGTRTIQVGQTRQMSTGDAGAAVFLRAAPGSQVHFAQANAGNQGQVSFGSVEVLDPRGSAVGGSFSITFQANPDYDPADPASAEWTLLVNDLNTGGPVPGVSGKPYVSGETVDLGGVALKFEGQPVDGDSFEVRAVTDSEMDLFKALDDVIAAIAKPTSGDPVAAVALQNALSTASRKISAHYDNVLTVQASVGARLNELDALDNEGSNRALNYKQQLSGLQDLDYRSASSDLAVRSMALQAAELAYMKVQNLGLFNRR